MNEAVCDTTNPSRTTENRTGRFLIALTVTAVLAVFFELGRMDVTSDNEGQRVTPPVEMLRSGDYIVPTINGLDYLVKPPLLYWAIAGVYKATGIINEWTARIPTAICSVLAVLCLYLCIRRETGEKTARWAALILLASPYFMDRSRWAELDVPLTLATMLSMFALRAACLAQGFSKRLGFAVLSGLSLGAAAMLKGPPAFLFVIVAWIAIQIVEGRDPIKALVMGAKWSAAGAIIATALLLLQRFQVQGSALPIGMAIYAIAWIALALRYGRQRRGSDLAILLFSMIIASILVAPWALAILERKGWPYINALIHNQVLERTGTATRINSGYPWYYATALPAMLAPWGLLLPLHFSPHEWRCGDRMYRFAIVGGWLSVGLYSLIAGKENEYILPAVPLLLIATAHHLARIETSALKGWTQRWAHGWTLVLLALLPVLAVGGAIYFAFAERQLPLIIEGAVIALAVLAIFAWMWKRRPVPLTGLYAMALLTIVLGFVGHGFHYTEKTKNSPKPLALACQELIDSGYRVETTKRVNFQDAFPYPALAFYLQRHIPLVNDPSEVRMRLIGKGPYFFIAREDFLSFFGNAPVMEKVRVLHGPYTSKKLVLVGNTDLAGK